MKSRAAVKGHPLHPMLIPLPIGFFVGALLGNIVFTVSDDIAWYDVAFWAGWAGVATALVAAVAGFIDYVGLLRSKIRTVATAHMLLNLGTAVLFAAAGMLSMDRGAAEGGELGWLLALQVAGVAMLAVSGWLGAEMVYRFGVAVNVASEEKSREAVREYLERGEHGVQT